MAGRPFRFGLHFWNRPAEDWVERVGRYEDLGLGKPKELSGLGLGNGWVSLAFGAVIVAMVSYLAVTKADRQSTPALEIRQP